MCVHSGQVLLQQSREGGEVGLHKVVVHSEERQVGRAVEEVGQADEGIVRLHIEQENGCEKRHALHVPHVRPVACICSQYIV